MLEQDNSQDTVTGQEIEAVSIEEELDAANVLLSLGDIRDGTQDDVNENVNLMPIGGQNIPIDAAPEPIKLDQIIVDNAIANLIQTEEQNKKSSNAKSDQTTERKLDADENIGTKTKSSPAVEDEPTVKGALEMRTYTLKKKTDNKRRSFKCSECKEVRRSIKELNIHHKESHNAQLCGICGRSFKLASTLTRHMYDHNSKNYHCDQCDYSCHFESELQTH